MDYRQQMSVEDNVLCFRPEGALQVADFLPCLEMLALACHENQIVQVFVDATGIIHEPITIMERFHLAVSAARSWPHGVFLAVVCRPDQLDRKHFGHTVAENRGLNIGVYENEADAQQWLALRSRSPVG
ncbi:MAG TPA: hypothetical protein VF681_05260 [Abditibacteriaceae bacterium]